MLANVSVPVAVGTKSLASTPLTDLLNATRARTVCKGILRSIAGLGVVENRVEILPQSLVDQVGPEPKKAAVPATITLNPDGSLVSFVLDAKFAGDGHRLELKYDFKFTGPASLQDMPKLPDAAQITVLPDRAAMDAFYQRLGKAQGS